jgi:hypothetical protein
MTATNETTDETIDGAPADETVRSRATGTDLDPDDAAAADSEAEGGVAEAAARDVARLLDRRGLREVVALAHRVLRE